MPLHFIPLNTQPREASEGEKHLDALEYVKIWYTIQGEGPEIGVPAVFVRLAGCNFTCPFCDTNYTKGRRTSTTPTLVDMISLQWPTVRLVVLTGGEPLRQNIGPFLSQLIRLGVRTQIETNGSYLRSNIPEETRIVCSPKVPKFSVEFQQRVNALKYVVKDGEIAPDGLPTRTLGMGFPPARPEPELFKGDIYVQPLDEQDPVANKRNQQAAVKSCMEHGYRLCLQVHKIVGLE